MIERYTRPEMGKLWTLENKFRTWLEVELAICKAWAKLGKIPEAELKIILDKADFDLDRILAIEEQTKHDLIAFLTAVEEKVGPASRFIHLGCTSSDVVDTANSLLLVRAGRLILTNLNEVLNTLKKLSVQYKHLLTIGRTHGVHAEPTSFGLKMATFFAEFKRNRQRLEQAIENVRVGKISGAVGNYAHLDPKVEQIACALLGLKVDPISTQIIQRDRYAQFFTVLAILAAGIERLCVELRHLQRTEVLEVEEGFSKGQKGSSAMPHKKNPISAENLSGLARIVRSNSLAALENIALWHERDISHSSVERVIMPDSTILVHYMLWRLNNILTNLKINQENMAKNLKASFGLFYSQRILLALIEKGLPRQQAYELVQKQALACWEEKTPFENKIRTSPEISKYLSQQELDQLFDPNYYLRYADLILNRVLEEE